jgi:signal transduction histidine kinase
MAAINSNLPEIGNILSNRASAISQLWMDKARRELDQASNAHREVLRDMIPEFLKVLGKALCEPGDEMLSRDIIARDHGLQRFEVGWKLNEVVADYQLLQIVLFEYVATCLKRSFTLTEINTIGAYLDEAIMVAVVAFAHESERALKSLNETLEERVIARTRQAEEKAAKLRKAAQELIRAKQREQKRIARILHDDLQQVIAASRFRAEGLEPASLSQAELKEELGAITKMLGQALTISRNLAIELKPPIDLSHITTMVKWVKDRMLLEFKLNISLDKCTEDLVVDQEIGFLIYQSFRELLFNVVKHGQCSEAAISINREQQRPEWLIVTVTDKGAGFDLTNLGKPHTTSGFGLNDIRDRLEMVDGKMEIWSMVGDGTRITMTLPTQL